jgi:hypothetical protein
MLKIVARAAAAHGSIRPDSALLRGARKFGALLRENPCRWAGFFITHTLHSFKGL